MPPENRPISVRLPNSLATELERRTMDKDDRSSSLRAHLARYYETCRRHFVSLDLKRAELALCCDALNGTWLASDPLVDENGASRIMTTWFEVADSIQLDKLHEKWGLTQEQADGLVARLQSATYAEICALVDFVERFWADDSDAKRVIYPEAVESRTEV